MPYFKYTTIDLQHIRNRGKIYASSLEEARKQLQNTGIFLLELRPCREGNSRSIPPPLLALFMEQLAHYLKAGMPLYESLGQLASQHRTSPFYALLMQLCEHIKQGQSLEQALAHYPTFPPVVLATIAAGQSSGRLEEALEELSRLLQAEEKSKKLFLSALIYPALLFSFSCCLIGILLFYVMPSMETLFADRPLHGFTRLILNISRGARHILPWIPPLVALGGILGFYRMRKPATRLYIEKKILGTPVVGPLLLQRELSRFSSLMGMMLERGIPILQALTIAQSTFQLLVFKKLFENIGSRILEGKSLSAELKLHKEIPDLFTQFLALGEEGGALSTMFHKIAALYQNDYERSLQRLLTLIPPILLVFLGAVVGLIMLSILLPLTDIQSFL